MAALTRRDLLLSGGMLGVAAVGAGALATRAETAGASPPGSGGGRSPSLSGQQYTIAFGGQSATVTELGAGLRSYSVNDIDLLDGYPAEGYPTGSSYGQVLSPWPNRIDHGTYTFDGVEQQLPWSEPANQNAIHGLTRWMDWEAATVRSSSLSMRLTLLAQPGYPFTIDLQHDYELTATGLTVTHTMRNTGRVPVPYGVGMHPYFTVGTDTVDTTVLELPADRYFLTNDRSIPTGPAVPVGGTPFDFRAGRPVGRTVFDTGFTGLRRTGGIARIVLTAPTGRRVTVWLDRNHEYVWVYSGDTLPEAARRRRSLAIEPYTCASNAFNSGFGVQVVPPGGTVRTAWGAVAMLERRR
jgi:aldose 1-epimerase